MIRVAALAAILIAAHVTDATAAPRVTIEGGNVVIDDAGARKTLTKSGRDDDPALSPDGHFVVFTRATEKSSGDDTSTDDMDCKDGADTLMRVNADGGGEAVLLRGRASRKPEGQLCGFTAKQFNSDGRLLYFLTPGWTTSGALHVYDFKGKAEHFVVAASGLFVLSACKNEHKDRVAIMRHKYFVFGGSYDWYWLYDPKTNKEIGPLGDIEEKDLSKQAEDWCAN